MIAWPFQKTKPPSSPEKLTCWFPFLLAEEFHLFPTFFSLISRLHHHSKPSSLSFSVSQASFVPLSFRFLSRERSQPSPVLLSPTSSSPSADCLLPHRHFFTLFTLSVSPSIQCSLLPVVVLVVAIVTNSNSQAKVQQRRGW